MKKQLVAAALGALAMMSGQAAAAETGTMIEVELREIPAKGRGDMRNVPLGSGRSIVVMQIVDKGTYRSGNKVQQGEDGKPVVSDEGMLIDVRSEDGVTHVRTEERTMIGMVPASADHASVAMPSYREVVSESAVSGIGNDPILMGSYTTQGAKPMLRFYTIRRM